MKKLIRFKPIGLEDKHAYDRLIERDRVETDKFLSRYFEIHPIEITPEQMKGTGISSYFRDNIAEVGNAIVVNKNLLPSSPDPNEMTDFQIQMANALFKGVGDRKILPSNDNSCHEALYLETDEFLLVSTKMSMGDYEMGVLGIDKPFYFMHQVSTPFSVGIQASGALDFNELLYHDANGHIDTRIGIVEDAKIIYVTPRHGPNLSRRDIVRDDNDQKLEDIARDFGYEVREYPYNPMMIRYLEQGEKALPKGHRKNSARFSPSHILGPLINGINFITDEGKLFTSYIDREEKKYLASKGVEAITVPINYGLNGAGLRCVYGEIDILKK